jgi:predicted CoA-binding protein
MKELRRDEISALLKETKTIAVVGISGEAYKTSRQIAQYLLENNYRVAGVNPAAPSIPGIPVYKSLTEIPFEIDIVNVFRRPETIGELIPDVIKVKPKCLWLQLGIRNDEEVEKAFNEGISIVQDACIYVLHQQLTA